MQLLKLFKKSAKAKISLNQSKEVFHTINNGFLDSRISINTKLKRFDLSAAQIDEIDNILRDNCEETTEKAINLFRVK